MPPLPPLNIPGPNAGTLPPINYGTGTPPPPPPGSISVDYLVALKNQIRTEMSNAQIQAILAKQSSNQTLTTDDQIALQGWEDLVEQEYSRRRGIAVPPDVQRRLELLAKKQDDSGSGGGSGGGGKSSGGGGGAARRPSGGASGGAAAGAHPAAAGAHPATGVPRPAATGAQARQLAPARTANGVQTAEQKAAAERAARLSPLKQAIEAQVRDESAQKGQKLPVNWVLPDPTYNRVVADMGNLLKKPGGPTPDQQNPAEVTASRSLKRLSQIAWQQQAGQSLDNVSPAEQALIRQHGLVIINPTTGKEALDIQNVNGVAALLAETKDNPTHPVNTFTNNWISMAVAGGPAALSDILREETARVGVILPGATTPTEAGAVTPLTTGTVAPVANTAAAQQTVEQTPGGSFNPTASEPLTTVPASLPSDTKILDTQAGRVWVTNDGQQWRLGTDNQPAKWGEPVPGELHEPRGETTRRRCRRTGDGQRLHRGPRHLGRDAAAVAWGAADDDRAGPPRGDLLPTDWGRADQGRPQSGRGGWPGRPGPRRHQGPLGQPA